MFVADVIGIAHACVAMFVTLGFGAICLGEILKWRWTQNAIFRAAHFGVIAFVALRLLVGTPCPLSVWEDHIRGRPSKGIIAELAFRGVNKRIFAVSCGLMFATTALLMVSQRCGVKAR